MARKSLERISQREYAKRLGISNEAVSRAIKEGRINKGWDKSTGKIIVEQANREWGALHIKINVSNVLAQEPGEDEAVTSNKDNDFQDAKMNAGSFSLNANSSFADAKRVREIICAQLVAIDLKERKGELVKKDEVYKQLFAFGQELRMSLMAIPDRVIDSVLASKNRAEALQVFSGEIYAVLEAMTKTDFNFRPRP